MTPRQHGWEEYEAARARRRGRERLAFAGLMGACVLAAGPSVIREWETAGPFLAQVGAAAAFALLGAVVVVGMIRAIEETAAGKNMPEQGWVGVEVPQAPVTWRDCLPADARLAWERDHIQPSPAEVQAAKEEYARLWAGHEGEATPPGWKGKAIYVDGQGNVLEYEIEETRRRWEERQAAPEQPPDDDTAARIRRAKKKIESIRPLQAGGDDLEIL